MNLSAMICADPRRMPRPFARPFRALRRWYPPLRGKFRWIYHSRIREPAPPPENPNRRRTILCVGTIGPRKAQPLLVEAFGRVAKKFPDALVLAADTLVFLDDEILGKPAGLSEAQQMLERLQGRTHQVVTGVVLIHLRPHREHLFAVSTRVRFRALTSEQIRDYLARVNPLDKAGAYAIQEHGDLIVEEISGSYSNVVGLPVERLQEELNAWSEPA